MAKPSDTLKQDELLCCSLRLLEDLTAAPGHRMTLDEAGTALGINPRQVSYVIDCVGSLSNLSTGTRSGVYIEHDDIVLVGDASLLAPRRLDLNESLALACVLDSLSVPEDVRARVQAALCPVDETALDASPFAESGEHGDFLLPITEAIGYGIRCRISYRSQDDPVAVPRTVDPIRIERTGQHAYLIAWDIDKDGMRRYRLDRIAEVVHTDDSVEQHAEEGLAVADSIRAHGSIATVRAESAAELLCPGWAGLFDLHEVEGAVEASLSFTSDRWLFDQLLAASPRIELVGPPETKRALTAYARDLLIP